MNAAPRGQGGAALQCFSFGEEDAQRTPAAWQRMSWWFFGELVLTATGGDVLRENIGSPVSLQKFLVPAKKDAPTWIS